MKTAEDFIHHILKLYQKKRSDLLMGRYGLNEELKKSMEECIKNSEKYSEDIPHPLLNELFAALQDIEGGYFFRDDIWTFVIKMNKNPLSVNLGIDLFDHCYSISDTLANSKQHLDVYFVAADKSKYARSRLCIRLFIEPEYSTNDLQKYLTRYGKESAIRVLSNKQPSPVSKYDLFTQSEIRDIQENWDSDQDYLTRKKNRKNLKRATYLMERMKETERIYKAKEAERIQKEKEGT